MSNLLDSPTRAARIDAPARNDQDIAIAVWSLLGTQSQQPVVERRRDQRFPFPYPIRLTPIENDGTFSHDKSVVVLGKHITEHGLDFYYHKPIPYRRVVASFERGREMIHITVDLTWCRFGRHGWYENGGRFLNLLPSIGSW